MIFNEIIDNVQRLVEDSSFAARIPSFINEAYCEAGTRANLPDLKTVTTVSTDPVLPNIPLPKDCNGKVLKLSVASTNATPIKQVDDVEALIDEFTVLEGNSGTLVRYAVEGSLLWYQKIPETAQTLIIVYYKNPPKLEDGGDIPTAIPAHLHRRLLVHGAAKYVFEEIEQDMEGESQERRKAAAMFERGIDELNDWVAGRITNRLKRGNTQNA